MTGVADQTLLIGADWGTTNLRAFRFGPDGQVLEQRTAPTGIGAIGDGAFEAALMTLIEDWLATGPPPILLSGMIGSQQGWIEAPYVACPTDVDRLALGLKRLETRRGPAYIVPGLSWVRADGTHDVMRGEETQILGALDDDLSGLVVTPGTHSKWVHVNGQRISFFRTFMSGEFYALLCDHSILGRLMSGREHRPGAFRLGVSRALADPALLSLLFSARAEGLFGALAPDEIAAYLSGLLIGAEIGSALAENRDAGAITIIGAPQIAALYQAALSQAGRDDVRVIDGAEAAARGLFRIGRSLI